MNILIPHSWLLEQLETKATPKEIQKYLSLCGPSVENIILKEGENVYDIEVTTNRVDNMSVRGIAREAAVILSQFGLEAKLAKLDLSVGNINESKLPKIKILNNPKICKRVTYVILENIKQAPTPPWMIKRLKQIDQNVHSALIDITNYITHELGHPCHAFDYNKLIMSGGEIIITEAQKNEKFTTLDGEAFQTLGGEVVFKNRKGEIIDLPSIKGTLNTSVDEKTTNVLLLMESIVPKKVRYASMTHAIRTIAAQLMEKGVDPNLAPISMNKAIKLYQDLCQPDAVSPIYDDFPKPTKLPNIILDKATLKLYLGVELENKQVTQILTDLECLVTPKGQTQLIVTPPSFRSDLLAPVDLVEEIARIYGYHRLQSQLMSTALPLNPVKTQNFDLENKIKILLVHLGVQEFYTYSLVSEELAKQSDLPLLEHIKLQNPLSEDMVYLRRSLIPSLVDAKKQNPNQPDLEVFELANVYRPQKNDLPKEELMLGIVSGKNYRNLRGKIEVLFESLFIKNYQFLNHQTKSLATIVATAVDGQKITLGWIKVSQDNLILAQIAVSKLNKVAKTHPVYQRIAKTSPVIEDLTFGLNADTLVGEVINTIRSASKKIINVQLKTIYRNNLTFTITYLDKETNLTNLVIQPIREKIVKMIEDKKLAHLVGTLVSSKHD